MLEPDNIVKLLNFLHQQGYIETFRADNNYLQSSSIKNIAPEDLLIDQIHRFEGISDIDEEVMIFALSSHKYHLKGLYIVVFGPFMDAIDCDMVHRLTTK